MAWINEHVQILSLVVSVLMLLVWSIYLQLFWRSYRRQLQANIVINRGAGSALDAVCLISNMSSEAINIEGIIVSAFAGEQSWANAVSRLSDIAGEREGTDLAPTGEGPLKAGDHMSIGSFAGLLRFAVAGSAVAEPDTIAEIDAIEIWVVADFGSENNLVFAQRRFLVKDLGDRTVIRPEGLETKRVRASRERRRIEAVLQAHLEAAVRPDRSS